MEGSNKTATDELRALLDARGVGYEANDHGAFRTTSWLAHGVQWNYTEFDGATVLSMNHGWNGATPAQAVEATLGRGECENVSNKGQHFMCSNMATPGIVEEYGVTPEK